MINFFNDLEKNLNLKNLIFKDNFELLEIEKYYNNAKADAIYCHQFLEKYLDKNKKILEIGGGIHLLTCYLNLKYNITSIEPGGFSIHADKLRKKIISSNNLKVHTITLENYRTDKKFDLIFSMNVLEHTKDIKKHILSCVNLLKDENSLLIIQCPNYTFPFESHFYKWFVPFFPSFTFKYLFKKKLIKKFGINKYNNILNSLNFDCTYFKIKSLNLPITFVHPLKNIFNRMENDFIFRNRLCQNKIISVCYKLINILKIKNFLIAIYPINLCPYLIMEITKKV